MTCPSLLLRRTPVAGVRLTSTPTADRPTSRMGAFFDRDDVFTQFARFLLAGGLANVLYATLFVGLAPLSTQAANLAGAVASSALANELHRRTTFRAGDRVGWFAAQWAGGGIALAGWAASSVSLGLLEAATGGASPVTGAVLVLSVTATVGLIRFAALRWVFRPAPARTA